MIRWLERHTYISYIITISIAIFIFYFSSLTSEQAGPAGNGLRPIIYHISIFFLLSLFFLISLVKGKNKKLIIPGILILLVYALLDEIHQSFVSGRSSSFSDIGLDAIGLSLALLVYFVSLEYKK